MIDEGILRKFYCDQQLSMMEVASWLGITHATVLYWLKRYQIPRRSWSESAYVKLNPNGDPFTIPTVLTREQRELMITGLLLYWAEGSKAQGRVRIANLDVRMLQLFARFLRKICHVNEEKLKVYVRVYRAFNLRRAKQYWAESLRLPAAQIHVYPHTDARNQPSRPWSAYGLATLEFHSSKFKKWLDEAIERYITQQLDQEIQGVRSHEGNAGLLRDAGIQRDPWQRLPSAGWVMNETAATYQPGNN